MLTQTSPLQVAIESVEALAEDEQDLVFDLIRKRRIELRREEIAQSVIKTMNENLESIVLINNWRS
jgi:hypothetical protein